MGAAILIVLLGLVAIGSAKPYEPYRKPSSPNQYPLYPYNFNLLYPESGRVLDEFLNRLFAELPKDSAGSVPFVRLDDKSSNDQYQEDGPISQSLDPRPEQTIDSELPNQGPVGKNEADNEQPLSNPDAQQEAAVEKPVGNNPSKDSEGQRERQEIPDKQAKENEREVEKAHKGDGKTAPESDKAKEAPEKHHNRPQAEQSNSKPRYSNGPKEAPSRRERPPFRADKTYPRGPGPAPQPGAGGSRQPAPPLVQINVNVASPVA